MTDQPPRWQCAVFILGLIATMLVMAPGMFLGALLRSRGFLWVVWGVAMWLGVWAAFFR